MATIVQPYNPWRENLAVTILGNVLGDLWTQHRQNEQNKKANAFRGQLMQDIQAQTAAQAPVSLSQQNLPEGYNSDGWTTSFHKTYTPLTAFDFGTAGIGGSTRLPTADEVQRLGSNLASTPRFAMLNPDTIQGFISQITQQNEQQRLKDLQNEAISHFMNAGSFDDKINALTAGMINGVVPADTQRNYGSYAQWRQQPFTFGSFKAGDRIYPFINNSNTGETSFQNAIPIGVPPEALLNAQTQQYRAELNAAAQANSPLKWKDSVYEAHVNHLYKANEGIDTRIAELRSQLEYTNDKHAIELINKNIEALQTQKQQNLDEARAIMLGFAGGGRTQQVSQTNQPQTSENSGELSEFEHMIGGANKGRITGRFGENRGDHKHKGLDLPGAAGTPIRIRQSMGSNPKVVKVVNDNWGGGYGNHVVIQADRGDYDVRFLIAHMQNGSVRVKEGQSVNPDDIIGGIGSTGRSSGNHVHFEVSVRKKGEKNWTNVNPETFFNDYPFNPQNSSTANQQTTSTPNVIPALENNVQNNSADVPLYQNANGDVITQTNFDELVQAAAKQGYGPVVVINKLHKEGFYPYSKKDIPQVAPILNWTPSYMGGNSYQGGAYTAPVPIPSK